MSFKYSILDTKIYPVQIHTQGGQPQVQIRTQGGQPKVQICTQDSYP